jgi:hypothetical protein
MNGGIAAGDVIESINGEAIKDKCTICHVAGRCPGTGSLKGL